MEIVVHPEECQVFVGGMEVRVSDMFKERLWAKAGYDGLSEQFDCECDEEEDCECFEDACKQEGYEDLSESEVIEELRTIAAVAYKVKGDYEVNFVY